MTVRFTGVPEFEAGVEKLIASMDAATRAGIITGGAIVERKAKEKLKTTAHAKGTKTPSAPGEPPSTVSGNLARSVRASPPERLGYGSYSLQVGPTAKYSRIQELGGEIVATGGKKLTFQVDGHWVKVDKVTLPARPYLEPALTEAVPELADNWHRAWRDARMFGK